MPISHAYLIDFRYSDDFNYPDTYPDARGQRGPDNLGSTVLLLLLLLLYSSATMTITVNHIPLHILHLTNAVAPVPATGPVFLWLESWQRDSNKFLTDPGDTLRPVTLLITTYQDIAERSAGTQWYNGNGRHVVMVGALSSDPHCCGFSFFLPFFLDKTKGFGFSSRLQEVKTTIPARGVWGAKPPPQLSALFSLAHWLP